MYALADCNNFFASCERTLQPELEGRPVIVLSNNDGIVIARSDEAKNLGIKMCAPYFQVRHMVDSGKVTACQSNHALYHSISNHVMKILAETFPAIEVYSIDEAFMLIDGIKPEIALKLCRDTVAKVRKEAGIPISIGIAPTKTLAKIASHFAKRYPGYKSVCRIDTEEKRLKALSLTPLKEVWGIGWRMAPKLEKQGIMTAADFVSRPEEWVRKNMGIGGLRTWKELQGIDAVEKHRHERRQSICTSRSFAGMISDRDEIAVKISDYAAQCAEGLRAEHSAARSVTVFLHTNRFRKDLEQYYPDTTIRFDTAANSTHEIVQAAIRGFDEIFRNGYLYKKAGVIVHDLVDADEIQGIMFSEENGIISGFDQRKRERYDKLSSVMDKFNCDGRNLLRLASQEEKHQLAGRFGAVAKTYQDSEDNDL